MTYANRYLLWGGGRFQDLIANYDQVDPYYAAFYWRFLFEQCGGMQDGVQDPAAGMEIVRRALTVLYAGEIVDISASCRPRRGHAEGAGSGPCRLVLSVPGVRGEPERLFPRHLWAAGRGRPVRRTRCTRADVGSMIPYECMPILPSTRSPLLARPRRSNMRSPEVSART